MAPSPINRSSAGIGFILVGMFSISLNDMMIKQLSGGYPLHQIVFVRSGIGSICKLHSVDFCELD